MASLSDSNMVSDILDDVGEACELHKDENDEWRPQSLHDMADALRTILNVDIAMNCRQLHILDELLESLLIDERTLGRALSFELILYTRLDKVVKALTEFQGGVSELMKSVMKKANVLQCYWQQRLKEQYFEIDSIRSQHMQKEGALRDMSLNPGTRENGDTWTIAHRNPIAAVEGDSEFVPGE